MWIEITLFLILTILILSHKKLRFTRIFKNYFKIFYNDSKKEDSKKRVCIYDLIMLFVFPLLISIYLVWCKKILIIVVSDLITIISIMSALLFSLLPLLISLQKTENARFNKAVEETFNVISFEILLGIFALFLLVFCKISQGFVLNILNNLCYYIVSIYIINIFLILKRFAIIFTYKLENNL